MNVDKGVQSQKLHGCDIAPVYLLPRMRLMFGASVLGFLALLTPLSPLIALRPPTENPPPNRRLDSRPSLLRWGLRPSEKV